MEWISVEPTVTTEEILAHPEYALGKLNGAQQAADAWEPGAGTFSVIAALGTYLASRAIAGSALPYAGLIDMAIGLFKPKPAPKDEANK